MAAMFLMPKRSLFTAITLVLSIGGVCPAGIQAQQNSSDDDFKASPAPGKATFNSTCAGCHGLDGRGSEKAPNIVSGAKVQHLSNTQIASIVSNGVPGTGMPAFHSLTRAQLHAVVSYLRTLQGRGEAAAAGGDSGRGRNIFFGKGECSNCHTVAGDGGFLGPDLTHYGAAMTAKAIRDGILSPSRIVPAGYKLAVATTHDGTRVEGIVRGEDNFSVQLQTREGTFHFVQKTDLQSLDYLDHSLMPTDYASRLTNAEIDDLVNYLANPGSSGRVAPGSAPALKQ
jgi:cytochrome c oxidase cbb3-type subunit III